LKILLKENLIFIIGMIVLIPIFQYFKGVENFEFDALYIKILIGVVFVFNIPAICILINYYIQNKDTTLEIDTHTDFIKINKKGKTKNYKISDIEISIYNIGIYYKNAIDNNSRWSTIHSDFGYWDLKFVNGDRYYLSNLLVDFLHEKAFVKKTKYRFRLFPCIDKSNKKAGIEFKKIQIQEKTRVEKFVEQYQSKNERQLREILDNKKSYQKEAVEAAELVLKNKNVG
jgi:hypothetical protein